MTKDEALKLALEALENMCDAQSNPDRRNFPTIHDYGKAQRACIAIKEALAQPAQECPNLKNCKGACFQCEYFNSATGEMNYPTTQPAQEPVACVQDLDEVKRKHLVYEKGMDWKDPLYTTPPQRTWVELTDEEKADLVHELFAPCSKEANDVLYRLTTYYANNALYLLTAHYNKLKEKNT